jgi:hypothetical protein
MESFDANKPLPLDIAINSAESHLYRIGLNLFKINDQKRSIFNNPSLIFIINSIAIIKIIISLLMTEDNERISIIIGDFSHFLGLRIHINLTSCLFFLLALTSQLIYFYNYMKGIKPTYFKVFEMMSGLISPKSIGLTNKEEIYKMLKVYKILFKICELNIGKIMPLIGFLINIVPYAMNCSIVDTILYGMPHSLLYAWGGHHILTINVWQVVYFYLICRYLKIKLKKSNELISQTLKKSQKTSLLSIERVINSLDSSYVEIDDYNSNFWSKYLLTIWLILGSGIVTCLYCLLFVKDVISKLIIGYAFVVWLLIFLLIINTASSVNYEAKKSYKLLHKFMATVRSGSVRYRTRNALLNVQSRKIKVKIAIK